MADKPRKDFFDAPVRGGKKAFLNVGNSTYSTLVEVDGKQPYYTYQGIGSLTGGGTQSTVTHNGLIVIHNGENVIHI